MLSSIATSTSFQRPTSCAAAIAFCSARKSRTLGATLTCAMAAAGLPARRRAMILSGQGEGRAKGVLDEVKRRLSAR